MIYTIGYQNTALNQIINIMEEKDIDLLIDVRSWPYSRNPQKYEFNKNKLQQKLKGKYRWVGNLCGGMKGAVSEKCIDSILKHSEESVLLLMCMENHPHDCHRFYDISKRLAERGIQAVHIFNEQERTTQELEESCHGK